MLWNSACSAISANKPAIFGRGMAYDDNRPVERIHAGRIHTGDLIREGLAFIQGGATTSQRHLLIFTTQHERSTMTHKTNGRIRWWHLLALLALVLGLTISAGGALAGRLTDTT